MSLSWPWALVALAAFPALLAFRWWTRRRRRRETLRLSSVMVIRAALPGQSAWRRRIPLWLFAAGLIVLGTGAARPQASVLVPAKSAAILLAIDVSASMCSTDVPPNRLTAAKKAAREFVEAQEDGTSIGLVAFGGIAGLVVEQTTDKEAVLDAIDGLRTSRGTAIGLAILASIDAIAEKNPDVAPTGVELPAGPTGSSDNGAYTPDTIVVLTDGRNTQGVDPVTAAGQAAARHVRVYTIGFGTSNPSPLVCTVDQISGDTGRLGDRPRYGFGGGGGGRYQQIDEEALTEVAKVTGGEYFKAADADELTSVLLDLPDSIVLQREDMEITVWFALAGALLVGVGVGLSQWWNRSVAIPTLTSPATATSPPPWGPPPPGPPPPGPPPPGPPPPPSRPDPAGYLRH
jgi:Ca-activated chloride channel family protein